MTDPDDYRGGREQPIYENHALQLRNISLQAQRKRAAKDAAECEATFNAVMSQLTAAAERGDVSFTYRLEAITPGLVEKFRRHQFTVVADVASLRISWGEP